MLAGENGKEKVGRAVFSCRGKCKRYGLRMEAIAEESFCVLAVIITGHQPPPNPLKKIFPGRLVPNYDQ